MKKAKSEKVSYQGRMVPKEHFRVFVYNANGQKLANSYEEFLSLLASKEWFEKKSDIPVKVEKVKKDDADSKGICK